MNVKPKIYALGNMDRKGELMEKNHQKQSLDLLLINSL